MKKEPAPDSDLILFLTEDGRTRLQVRLEGETVWLSLNQMADLFQRDKSVISRHIRNVFEEGELVRDSVVADSATVQTEGGKQVTREIESAMRSESAQKETPGPLNRKRSRKGSRGQRAQCAATVPPRQTHISPIKEEKSQ